jgi:hypothetical protein
MHDRNSPLYRGRYALRSTIVNTPDQPISSASTIKVTGQNGTATTIEVVADGMDMTMEN